MDSCTRERLKCWVVVVVVVGVYLPGAVEGHSHCCLAGSHFDLSEQNALVSYEQCWHTHKWMKRGNRIRGGGPVEERVIGLARVHTFYNYLTWAPQRRSQRTRKKKFEIAEMKMVMNSTFVIQTLWCQWSQSQCFLQAGPKFKTDANIS